MLLLALIPVFGMFFSTPANAQFNYKVNPVFTFVKRDPVDGASVFKLVVDGPSVNNNMYRAIYTDVTSTPDPIAGNNTRLPLVPYTWNMIGSYGGYTTYKLTTYHRYHATIITGSLPWEGYLNLKVWSAPNNTITNRLNMLSEETRLHVSIPSMFDFIGIARNALEWLGTSLLESGPFFLY